MAAIYPVGTQRVSDLLLQTRLLSQFQYDKAQLLKLQDQLSTGYRITAPSQDAPAAARAITLQRVLEQKAQARTNLANTQAFLTAAENALNGAADLISSVQARSLAAVNFTTTDSERQVLKEDVQRVIEQLVHVGNQEFRGRPLFAGSVAAITPFTFDGSDVAYQGNTRHLTSYVDLGFLTETNLTGDQIFGALSPELASAVQGTLALTADTRLADLRGGAGITSGSIRVSDGYTTRTVDITGAVTIGDVARILRANPPEGRQLEVRVTPTGLWLDLDDVGGGSLTVRDLPGGTTAAELGLVQPGGAGVQPLVGGDLDPLMHPTSRLQDLFGARASGVLRSQGARNDMLVAALQNGDAWNGVQVKYISDQAAGDQALAHYDADTKTLVIDVRAGVTTARTVVAAINQTGLFRAQLDDQLDPFNDGSGTVDVTAESSLTGGRGFEFDRGSGIQVVNRGQTFQLSFADAETVQDLLNQLNYSAAGVVASLNSTRTGIDVRSRISGADFAIGENGGTTATELGIRTFTAETRLSALNYARGVEASGGIDFVITRQDGVSLALDVSGCESIAQVLQRINEHADNQDGALVARLARTGNGIELWDTSSGSETLTVRRTAGSAAWDLGLVPRGESEAAGTVVATDNGPAATLQGSDVAPLEVKGVLNSLIRLHKALEQSDPRAIERAVGMLEADFERLNFARADLGTRGQALDAISYRLDAEDVELRKSLSLEIDADMITVISELTARQASIEASLRLIGKTMQLTLLDFV